MGPAPFQGIYAFDVSPHAAHLRARIPVDAEYRTVFGYYNGDEIQGIAIQPTQNWGQIHLLMVDVDAGTDDVYFKHYQISDPGHL